jgi:hypothetical protein
LSLSVYARIKNEWTAEFIAKTTPKAIRPATTTNVGSIPA